MTAVGERTSTLVVTSSPACDVGCCLVSVDPTVGMGLGNYARPMFQVIPDDGVNAASDAGPWDGMTVEAADYDRPDRIFL